MKTNIPKLASKKFVLTALTALVVCGLTVAPASAQNPTFAPGDLILYFLQFGGTQTAMINLGPAWTYRDATANMINLANVGTVLTGSVASGGAGYSSTWYDDVSPPVFNGGSNIPITFWGFAAVRSVSTRY